MKGSRIQAPGASERAGTVNTTYLGETQQQALLADSPYLASILSFLIK